MSEQSPSNPEAQAGDAKRRLRFDWGAFASHLTTFLSVAIVLGLVAGFLLLRQPMHERVDAISNAGPVRISIEWPPLKAPAAGGAVGGAAGGATAGPKTWLAAQFQEELLTLSYRALGSDPDPLSRAPLDAIGSALESSGWFDGVPSVTRRGGSEIVVRGVWRIPAAVVRVSKTAGTEHTPAEYEDRLVSWDGRAMPVVYPEGKSGLYVLRRAAGSTPRTSTGEVDFRTPWGAGVEGSGGADVQAGLELLRLLVERPWRSQIAGIDLSSYSTTRQLTIETTHGTRLVWGGPVSNPLPGECSTPAKLAKIDDLFRLSSRVDAGYRELELWWPINKPLEIDRSASAGPTTATAETPVPPDRR